MAFSAAEPMQAGVHAAEQRGGALGRHEVAARAPRGVSGRGRPAGWAGSRGEREEEDSVANRHLYVKSVCARGQPVASV
eukprot:scaffold38836_cov67-Phaeocystis_antarctica.AAC.6